MVKLAFFALALIAADAVPSTDVVPLGLDPTTTLWLFGAFALAWTGALALMRPWAFAHAKPAGSTS